MRTYPYRQALASAQAKMEKEAASRWKLSALILDARAAELRGKPKDAVEALRAAVVLDEKEPPSGPAGAVTARERLGELLLRQQKAGDALVELRKSLELHPRRSRSLLGAARAATLAHDPSARDYYTQLAANWSQADADFVGLAEVRQAAAQH